MVSWGGVGGGETHKHTGCCTSEHDGPHLRYKLGRDHEEVWKHDTFIRLLLMITSMNSPSQTSSILRVSPHSWIQPTGLTEQLINAVPGDNEGCPGFVGNQRGVVSLKGCHLALLRCISCPGAQVGVGFTLAGLALCQVSDTKQEKNKGAVIKANGGVCPAGPELCDPGLSGWEGIVGFHTNTHGRIAADNLRDADHVFP